MMVRGVQGLRAGATLWGRERVTGIASCLWLLWESHIAKRTVLNSEETDGVGERPRRMSSEVRFRHHVSTTGKKDELTWVLPGQAWLYLHSPSVPSLLAAGSRAGSRHPAALAP